MPQIPVTGAPSPLAIEAQRIDENTQPPQLDAVAPLRAGLRAGQAVTGQVENIKDIEKATEFEALLQSGEEGMNAAMEDAKAQGVDMTGVPDPKLYLRSPEDSARWYAFVAEKLKSHQNKQSRGKAFEQISGDEPKEGFSKLVEIGDIDAAEGAKEVRKIDFDKRLQTFVTGEQKIVSDEIETPEGAVAINVAEFAPLSESINDSLKSRGAPAIPDDIRVAIDSAAKKLNMPANILVGIASREADHRKRPFDPASKNPISSASGLGQLLAKSTGKEMFKIAQDEGLIGKDVAFETAIFDPEMNMIMTGVLFKQNLKTTGNVRDALLAHRMGAGAVDDFNETGKFIIEGRDESADIVDWISDVMAGGEIVPGMASDGGSDLFSLEGINIELERLRTNTEFSATPQAKVAIKVLEDRKDDLIAKNKIKDKAKGKLSANEKESKVASTIDLVIALADQVEPSGILKGTFKNLMAFLKIDAPTATLNQFSGLLAGQMAKGVGGESGRLTDQDRAFALAAMPTATDSDEIRSNKKAILRAIVANIRDAEGGDKAAQKRIRRAVYINAKKFGKQMLTKDLLEMWKEEPTDELIERFLWSNGKDGDSATEVAKFRATLEKGNNVGPAPIKPATTIQSRGEIQGIAPAPQTGGQIRSPAAVSPEGGFGGEGFIPLNLPE